MANKYLDENGLLYFWGKVKDKFVAKVSGKGLSTNDFTNSLKTKLEGVESGAEANVIETVKVNNTALTPSEKAVNIDLSGYVEAVSGKGLSTNDYTTTEKNKLAGIATGAEVNVQANWNETSSSSDAYIKNKPTIPSKTSDLTNDSSFVSDSAYTHTDNNYTTTEKTKLGGVASGAQVNVIETIKVNNTALTPSSKAVNIDLSGYALKSEIADVYQVAGSATVATLNASTKSEAKHGKVYNLTDSGNLTNYSGTTAVSAGDNVVFIWGNEENWYWDKLSATVDLSNYVQKETGKGLSTNDFTDAYKTKLTGIQSGAQVNVQADWNQTDSSEDDYIKNKPTIPAAVTVDSALSSTSENPVQNKVIKAALDNKMNTSDMVAITNAEIDTIVAT